MIVLPENRQSRRFVIRIFALAAITLMLACGAAAWLMYRHFEARLSPELESKSALVADALTAEIGGAIELGIPFSELWGMETLLDRVLADNPDIDAVVVSDADGSPRFARGDPGEAGASGMMATGSGAVLQPILVDDAIVGTVAVLPQPGYAQAQLSAILQDVLIVLLVSVLVAVELLMIVLAVFLFRPISLIDEALERAGSGDFRFQLPSRLGREFRRVTAPFNALVARLTDRQRALLADAEEARMGQIDPAQANRVQTVIDSLRQRLKVSAGRHIGTLWRPNLNVIRGPLFVFILSEEMSRAFLPVFIRSVHEPVSWMSDATAIGIPISIFMLTIAVVTPFAGPIADRIGARRMFLIGALPGLIGYVGTAFATSLLDLTVWRAVSAIGYAVIYIAAQGYVARHSREDSRTQGMALFMGAVFAAGVCGPALGGVLADQIGYRATFIVSAALAVLSGAMVFWLLEPDRPVENAQVRRRLRLADVGVVLANPGFAALVFLAAIPGKIVLTAFLFYLAPLFLNQLGNTSGETGRVIMLYGAATVLLTPVVAHLADRWGGHWRFIAFGGIVAGAGLLPVAAVPTTMAMLGAVVLLGVGHAMSITPQLAMVTALTPRECERLGHTTVMSVYRVLERLGNVVGPFIAAALVSGYGEAGAVTGIGLLVLASTVAFAGFNMVRGAASARRAEA